SRWSKNLINHAIYPAVFLFVMLIISNFMASSGNILPGSISGQEGIGNLIMVVANIAVRLGFVLVMLYFALKASDYIEVAGSSIANQIGNTLTFGGLEGYRKGLGFVGNRLTRAGAATVSQPLGMTAYDLNKSLKNTGLLNRNGIVGATARGLSNGVLQPVSKTSLAGEKSFSQLASEADHKAHESKDRDLLEKARKVADPENDLDKKEKEAVNKMSPETLTSIPPKDLDRLAVIFSEKTKDKIQESKNINDSIKHNVEHAWHEHAGAAPQQQANEMIKELRKIDTQLGGLSDGTETVVQKLQLNTKINKAGLKSMKEVFEDKMPELNANFEAARAINDKVSMAAADKDRTRVKRALEAITKLGEHSGKVPGGYEVKV
ncbi:MAG TPA: hypothetical protein VN701_02675, partial [Candidatus Paceibacterota bacterium]|nr:hypothetical protein [Candidatus Paceibacterota bacterium]